MRFDPIGKTIHVNVELGWKFRIRNIPIDDDDVVKVKEWWATKRIVPVGYPSKQEEVDLICAKVADNGFLFFGPELTILMDDFEEYRAVLLDVGDDPTIIIPFKDDEYVDCDLVDHLEFKPYHSR